MHMAFFLHVLICTICGSCACIGQRKALEPLEVEICVSCYVGVRNQTQSSARTASAS